MSSENVEEAIKKEDEASPSKRSPKKLTVQPSIKDESKNFETVELVEHNSTTAVLKLDEIPSVETSDSNKGDPSKK